MSLSPSDKLLNFTKLFKALEELDTIISNSSLTESHLHIRSHDTVDISPSTSNSLTSPTFYSTVASPSEFDSTLDMSIPSVNVQSVGPLIGPGGRPIAVQTEGICDNQGVFESIEGHSNLGKLVFKNINIAPFLTADTNNHAISVQGYRMAMVFSRLRETNRPMRPILGAAEVLIPDIPLTSFLAEAVSRQTLVDVIGKNWADITQDPELSAGVIKFREDDGCLWINAGDNLSNLDLPSLSPDVAMKVLAYMVNGMSTSGQLKLGAPIVTLILAYAKRGNISTSFLRKLTRDLDVIMPGIMGLLDRTDIQRMWANFGKYITDENAQAVTTRWGGYMPATALRLKITLEQAKSSGMTSLEVIIRAMRIFSDFPWYLIRRFFPLEMDNVLLAVGAVGTNEWYGYRADMGPVNSRLYLNISWVAKTILIKMNKEGTLNSYNGWISNPDHQAALDTMIANYESGRTGQIDVTSPMNASETAQWTAMQAAFVNFPSSI